MYDRKVGSLFDERFDEECAAAYVSHILSFSRDSFVFPLLETTSHEPLHPKSLRVLFLGHVSVYRRSLIGEEGRAIEEVSAAQIGHLDAVHKYKERCGSDLFLQDMEDWNRFINKKVSNVITSANGASAKIHGITAENTNDNYIDPHRPFQLIEEAATSHSKETHQSRQRQEAACIAIYMRRVARRNRAFSNNYTAEILKKPVKEIKRRNVLNNQELAALFELSVESIINLSNGSATPVEINAIFKRGHHLLVPELSDKVARLSSGERIFVGALISGGAIDIHRLNMREIMNQFSAITAKYRRG